MARKPKVHYEGALYHVIVCGTNRDFIFSEADMKQLYIEKVIKYIEKYRARLYAYVIMDNHVHLLIEVSDKSLSKIMQLIQ
ncbi:MAG: transposase [Clostridia bacterium]|nr:transposase [Clostridia bacterium]